MNLNPFGDENPIALSFFHLGKERFSFDGEGVSIDFYDGPLRHAVLSTNSTNTYAGQL